MVLTRPRSRQTTKPGYWAKGDEIHCDACRDPRKAHLVHEVYGLPICEDCEAKGVFDLSLITQRQTSSGARRDWSYRSVA